MRPSELLQILTTPGIILHHLYCSLYGFCALVVCPFVHIPSNYVLKQHVSAGQILQETLPHVVWMYL